MLLFDCIGFGPSNMDVVNFLYILQCLQSYFPETLAVLYLHKAPWILQRAWHAVKWLLDPVVRAKVQFTNHAEELMQEVPKERLLKYIGGDVDVQSDAIWVPPEEGENDLQKDKTERKRRWDNHRRLCSQFEEITRKWAASKGKEGAEERRILAKKLRLSHFDYEPYWLGKWVHHRNGDLPLTNPGIVRFQYPMVNGEKICQVMGHEDSRKSVLRELHEIAVGAPVDFVEARTKQLLKDGKWGQWDTCDDLPALPTDFRDGQLKYDGDYAAAALIDVIGLNGPETINAAKAQVVEHDLSPAATIQVSNEAARSAAVHTIPNGAPVAAVAAAADASDSPTAAPAQKASPRETHTSNRQTTATGKDAATAPRQKKSFLQTLKKKAFA